MTREHWHAHKMKMAKMFAHKNRIGKNRRKSDRQSAEEIIRKLRTDNARLFELYQYERHMNCMAGIH